MLIPQFIVLWVLTYPQIIRNISIFMDSLRPFVGSIKTKFATDKFRHVLIQSVSPTPILLAPETPLVNRKSLARLSDINLPALRKCSWPSGLGCLHRGWMGFPWGLKLVRCLVVFFPAEIRRGLPCCLHSTSMTGTIGYDWCDFINPTTMICGEYILFWIF